MRKFLAAAILISGFLSCDRSVKGANGVVYKRPSDYNDYIVTRQSMLMNKILDFGQVAQTNLDSAGKMLDTYILDAGDIINDIKAMPAYHGDSTLRDAAINSFNFYKRVFSEDYKQILHIRKDSAEVEGQGIETIQAIVTKITKEEERFDRSFHNAQTQFARDNNMQLADNELQKRIDKYK